MNLEIITDGVEADRGYIEGDVADSVKPVENPMKDSLDDLLALRANRNKERGGKEDLSSARLDGFFSDSAYRSGSTEGCSSGPLEENGVSIDGATLIPSPVAETVGGREKRVPIN